MAVNEHPIGGFRAYKKINGVEHQFYSFERNEADLKQEEFDNLAAEAINNAPTKLFSKTGRFVGFSINAVFRKKRTPKIIVQMQIKKEGQLTRKMITHRTNELTWRWIRREWKDFYEVSIDERIALQNKINLAKSLYEADISTAKIKIEDKLKQFN